MPRLRHRRAALFATLIAVALGAALAAACAGLFETALRLDAPPQRLAGADAVIAPVEHATLAAAEGKSAQEVALTERGHLPAGTLAAVRAVPGVTRAALVADLGVIAVTTRNPAALRRPAAGGGGAAGSDTRATASLPPGVAVLTGDDRGRAEAVGVAGSRIKLVLLSSVFGGTALIVMAILLASIIGLSIEQRHRELALLRTIGATPKQVRRVVVRATLRPAWLAALAGAALGPFLATALFTRIRDGGVVPDVLVLRQGPEGMVVGAIAALLITRVAAGLAARKAGRAQLTAALGEAEPMPGALARPRVIGAMVLAAGAVSCGVVTLFMSPTNAAATGGGTALAGALACALVAPRLIERLAGRLRPTAFTDQLAVLNVRARSHRNAALVIPVLLVASIALANVYQQTTQTNAVHAARTHDVEPGAAVISSSGWIEHPVDRSHRIDPWSLLGADPSTLKAKAKSGDLADLHGAAVALPQGLNSAVGDTIGMVLGDGAHVRLNVVAILDGSSRNRSIILPAKLLRAHTAGPARPDPPQVDVWITFAVVAVIVAYAALSLINSLVAALTGRRRELALLHLAGATRKQLRRMLEAEALVIAGVGALTGTAVAIAGLIPLAVATAGSPLPSGPPWVFAAVLALVAALVLIPTRVVAATALRNPKVNDVENA
jgi:putative ABC transport system permease protein